MAVINGVYIFSPTDKSSMTITDGDQSEEGDVNTVWETVDTKLSLIETDMAAVNAQATNAELWATEVQGVDLGTNQYSAEANALEAEEWASSEDGIINKADGTTPTAKSSKEYSEDSSTFATASSNSADDSAVSALASASSANFEGTWSAGTYNQPASVFYNGEYWNLDAVSTTGEPGVSSDWIVNDAHKVKLNSADVTPGYLDEKIIEYPIGTNLLINPNFKVNQEEYVNGAAIAIGEYGHDMFECIVAGLYSVSGEEISLTGCQLRQKNDDIIALSDGVDVVLTVSVESGSVYITDYIDEASTVTPASPMTFTYNSASSGWIGIGDSGNHTFSGLKLEVGEIATKYEIPQVTEEELKCLRYLRFHLMAILASYVSATQDVYYSIDTGFPMPRLHAVTLDGAASQEYYDFASNVGGGTKATLTTQTISSHTGNSVYIKSDATVSGSPLGKGTVINLSVKLDARY